MLALELPRFRTKPSICRRCLSENQLWMRLDVFVLAVITLLVLIYFLVGSQKTFWPLAHDSGIYWRICTYKCSSSLGHINGDFRRMIWYVNDYQFANLAILVDAIYIWFLDLKENALLIIISWSYCQMIIYIYIYIYYENGPKSYRMQQDLLLHTQS